MILALLLIPTITGAAAFLIKRSTVLKILLMGAALVHAACTALLWHHPIAAPLPGQWLAVDAPALLFLSITSLLFLCTALYACGYLTGRRNPVPSHYQTESAFIGYLLLFLASMTLVIISQHPGLLWVAVEATTLVSAPLIFHHHSGHALEATWKYLLICSVGIALALLGNFFLNVAASGGEGLFSMTFANLMAHATALDATWLKSAFILFLVGYGTKMGLAPLHTWLPDAHSEAPSLVSALLSGALLNCAFLAILRLHALLVKAGLGHFSQSLLILFGLLSMFTAAIFIIGQSDYKRMLAYSSVEHMGILALGAGFGAAAGFGTLLHAINHSLVKTMLFLLAGNILAVYGSKSIDKIQALNLRLPLTAALWTAGFLAITGTPPFGVFLSKFMILKAGLTGGHAWAAALALLAMTAIFIGLAMSIIKMVYTPRPAENPSDLPVRERTITLIPPLLLGLLALGLGLYLPPALKTLLIQAAHMLGLQ